MWKRIIIYIIILIILLGLYLILTPQAIKSPAETEGSQKESSQNLNQVPKFKGPTEPPSVKGPSGPPPTRE